jgi:hypothetical protein
LDLSDAEPTLSPSLNEMMTAKIKTAANNDIIVSPHRIAIGRLD